MATLTLMVPGLFRATTPPDLPRTPALELILARAQTRPGDTDYRRHLFSLFGGDHSPGADVPAAALSHRVDFDDQHERVWIRADPVYLRPDLHKLLLFDSTSFALDEDEAQTLIAEINAALGTDNGALQMGKDCKRWYLPLDTTPEILTQAPEAVIGRHIDPLLPQGSDATHWHRLGNEIQMVLHQSPVNQARESRGEPPINSVWFWGAGNLPSLNATTWTRVWSSDPMVHGLAKLAGCPVNDEMRATSGDRLEYPWEQTGAGNYLVVLDGALRLNPMTTPNDWQDFLMTLEADWCSPALRALRAGRISSLRVDAIEYEFVLTRPDLAKLWRRRRPIGAVQRHLNALH